MTNTTSLSSAGVLCALLVLSCDGGAKKAQGNDGPDRAADDGGPGDGYPPGESDPSGERDQPGDHDAGASADTGQSGPKDNPLPVDLLTLQRRRPNDQQR